MTVGVTTPADPGGALITTLGTVTTGVWSGTAVGVTKGGTGLTSVTGNNVIYASASNTIGQLTLSGSAVFVTTSAGVPASSNTLSNGQLVIGSTGAKPGTGTITAGAGVTVTNGAASITIAAATAAFYWITYSTNTTTTITGSYNVASVTDNGTGDTTVTFTNAFSNTNYNSTSGGQVNGAGAFCLIMLWTQSSGQITPVAGSIRACTFNNVSVATDYDRVCLTGFGT